jgi:hypothetical protein
VYSSARGVGECACGAGDRSAQSTPLTMSMKRVNERTEVAGHRDADMYSVR